MKQLFLAISILSLLSLIAVITCGMTNGGNGNNGGTNESKGGWCALISENSLYLGSGAIHFFLLSFALFFLWKKDLSSTLDALGFPGEPKKILFYSVTSLMVAFSILLIVGFLSVYLGINDQEKVMDKVTSLPLLVLAFAIFGAPVTEELFFRGFLTARFGILGSSLLFGLMHLTYGSTVEVIGAFLIGIVLALTFKLSKSITPCLIAHMSYNLLAIIVMVQFT